ncbi:MAG: tRNA-dihydrouridine synthase, partial [Pseudomonadota bacterium]
VMLGRAAYETPYLLADVDSRLFGEADAPIARREAALAMEPVLEAHIARGGRSQAVLRHMLGLYKGRPGAKVWRRMLSVDASANPSDARLLRRAVAAAEGGASLDSAA